MDWFKIKARTNLGPQNYMYLSAPEILKQAASTRCSGDNKEKLSTNIGSEYASDFCHDRKSAFTVNQNSLARFFAVFVSVFQFGVNNSLYLFGKHSNNKFASVTCNNL